MLNAVGMLATVIWVVALPTAGVVLLLLAVKRRERAREARVARQIAVTDAIHSELGAVVAPVVNRRVGRGWRVAIAVPFGAPTVVARVVAIAHATMLRDGPAKFDIVLTAQTSHPRPLGMPERARTSPRMGEREVLAWTGTSTSRAS